MTCEEFRKTATETSPMEVSRGVCAAMNKHALECEACYEFVCAGPHDPATLVAGALYKLKLMEDPEFVEAAFPKGYNHDDM